MNRSFNRDEKNDKERGVRSMRKNKMLRLASGMLVATLLSTSVISGTFAKYVTTAKASDTAVVAKWGVTVSASGSLFGEKYSKGTTTNTPTTSTTAGDFTVESKNSSNLVAPGTQSDTLGFTFGINGTPEVTSKVSAEIVAKDIYLAQGTYGVMEPVTVNETTFAAMIKDGLYTLSGTTYTKLEKTATYESEATYYALAYTAKVGNKGYYPVVYAWTSGSTANDKYTKATEIAEKIAKKINSSASDSDTATIAGVKYTVNQTFNPNTDLAGAKGIDLSSEKLTWKWAFGTAETEVGKVVEEDSDDARDTLLGDLIAFSATNNQTQVVSVTKTNSTVTGVTVLTIDNNTKIVKNGETEVGCLETTFDIKLTVEQVD
jgi:hypothetical protein